MSSRSPSEGTRAFPLVLAIIKKDIFSIRKILLLLFIIGFVFGLILTPVARSMVNREAYEDEHYTIDSEYQHKYNLTDSERYELQKEEEADELERDFEDISALYTIAVFVSVIVFLVCVNVFYGKELKKGTIRSLSLYPIGMNGLTFAKILSILIIAGIIFIEIFLIPTIPFIVMELYPWLTKLILVTYIMNALILVSGAYGAHIFTYFLNNVKISVNRLVSLFLILSVIFTETVLLITGFFIIAMGNLGSQGADDAWSSWRNTVQDVSVISPYHAGGRIITDIGDCYSGSWDLHFIIPVAILITILGIALGRKIYLDVFIKD